MNQIKKISVILLLGSTLSGEIMAGEEIKYEMLKQEGDIELRLYAPYLIAETIVDAEFDEAGGDAFRTLFNYISGDNKSQQEIAMTAPVAQEIAGKEIAVTTSGKQQKSSDKWAVGFMIPIQYTLESVPEPTDPNVKIRQVARRYIASITYSGLWNQSGYQEHYQKLQQWINDAGYQVDGEAVWARYDPPFKPWFLRRNEVLIPIKKPK